MGRSDEQLILRFIKRLLRRICKMKLLEQMQQKIKMKGLSPKTFETYAQHCEDFFRFLLKRFGAWKHPKDVGRPEIEAWLTHKANVEHCSKSSQNTALQSVLYLYREILAGWFVMRTVTEAKRGIPCPRCNGREFEVEESGRYIVKDAARDV